jgi:putative ABC transport system ATP-binding protein
MPEIASTHELFRFHSQGDERVAVLKGVTLAIEEGEFVCVMGPSGSGKTTLLHVLSGLDRADAGRVRLGGAALDELTERNRTLQRRRTIGYVFQFFNLLPNLSVLENVALPLAIQGQRPERERERLRALLARLGLAARESALPHELSGGEMQRASIARALAGGQPLILADEPTGNLSQQAGLEVLRILRQACDEDRRAVLLVTHNPRDATFADRLLFLVDGALAEGVELRGPGIPVESVHETLARLSI